VVSNSRNVDGLILAGHAHGLVVCRARELHAQHIHGRVIGEIGDFERAVFGFGRAHFEHARGGLDDDHVGRVHRLAGGAVGHGAVHIERVCIHRGEADGQRRHGH
jgi:hypothetical protein